MKKFSFSLKTVLIILAVSLTTILVFASYSIRSVKKELVESHEITGLEQAHLMTRMVRNALIINDYKLLNEIPAIFKGSDVKGISINECAVISPDGKFIVHSDPSKNETVVKDSVLLNQLSSKDQNVRITTVKKATGGNELVISETVTVGGIHWGDVFLTVSLRPVDNILSNLIAKSALAIAIICAASLLISFWASTILIRPIKNLTSKVDRLAREENTEKIAYGGADEVGDLISSFNRMLDVWQSHLEEALHRKEEADTQRRLSDAVVENIRNGIIVLDGNGVIIRTNSSVFENTNLEPSMVTGKFFWDVFPEWENQNTRNIFIEVLEQGKKYLNERVYYETAADSKTIVFNVNICPMIDEGGVIFGAVVLFEFLTDKILLEEHLLRANEELKRASDVKSEFLSMVSHELRTPLTLIKMYSSLLTERKLGPLNEKQGKAVEVVNRRCRNLHELIDDLLDLSRIESGRYEINFEELALGELISETIAGFKHKAADAGLDLEYEISENIPSIIADRDKLSRVLNNLIENAIKFTEKGGIRVIAGKNPQDERQALISVIDTGTGIAPEHQEKIFEKFYQVDRSDTRKHGGSGLGLAIAFEIAALHHGRLWLKSSNEGEGSRFCFTVLFASPDILTLTSKKTSFREDGNARKESAEKDILLMPGEKHVLLIDDDQDFLDMITDVLSEDGYIVHQASDGLKGIEILFSGDPVSIILLDVTMPGISGYEVCRMIKAIESKKNIPVLMLTAAGQSEQIENGYIAGASGYLVKPFTLEIFKKTILSIIGGDKRGGR